MRTTKSKAFTKQKMISDIKELREDCIVRAMSTKEIAIKYNCLYNYKVFKELFELNFLKIDKKIGKKKLYKWNFDRKVDVNLYDSLYKNAVNYRTETSKKSVISQKTKEQNDLKKHFQELPSSFPMWSSREKADYLDSLENKPQNDFENENENTEKNVFGKSLMRKCLYSGNLFVPTRPDQLFENAKARSKYHNKYYVALDKTVKEKNENEKKYLLLRVQELEDLVIAKDKEIARLNNIITNQENTISELISKLNQPQENKQSSFRSVVKKQETKQAKYLKLFGIKIYEKN